MKLIASARLDVLGLLVGDLHLELLLHRHHQLDDVERVGAEVLDEGGVALISSSPPQAAPR